MRCASWPSNRASAFARFGSRLTPLTLGALASSLVVLMDLVGCKDASKVNEQRATQWSTRMTQRARDALGEVTRGLPVGAEQLTALYAEGADPTKDLPAVRKGLSRVRGNVPDLARAASTFFALTDAQGLAVRNDLEEDVMAGQDILALFPELRATKQGGVATAVGRFGGAHAPGEADHADRDWVAAAPVKDAKGTFEGLLVTGWTLRRFAFQLQEALKHDLGEEQTSTNDPGKLPIVYVALFDASGLYAPPMTPPVNEKALVDLGLVTRTVGGMAHGTVSITERDFGYGAVRVPELEPNAGVVVLWSEL